MHTAPNQFVWVVLSSGTLDLLYLLLPVFLLFYSFTFLLLKILFTLKKPFYS